MEGSMDTNTILEYLNARHKERKISSNRVNNIVEDLKKPCYSSEEEKKILSECRSMVDGYKERSCKVPKNEFDAMVAAIDSYVNNTSPLLSVFRVSMVELMDDVVSATLARVLEEEGKLVGCNSAGLLEAMEGLNRRVVPAEEGGGRGVGGGSGQSFVCREEFGKVGAVVRMTNCGYSCHSRCLLLWHGENAACPNFVGSCYREGRMCIKIHNIRSV